MTGEGGLRARALLDKQFEVVVVVLIVLAGVGGYLAYGAYAQPNTTTETNEVTVWAPDGTFTHGSTVIDNESRTAGVFDPGQRVENRSFYYISIMPILSGEFQYRYTAESGEVEASIEKRLVVRSVDDGGRRTVEYWRETESLGRERTTLAPGETATVPYRVNVTDATAVATEIRDRLDDPGQTRVSLNVTVALTGTAGGQSVDRTLEYGLPIAVDDQIYRVESTDQVQPVTRTEQTTVTNPPGPLPAYGGPALIGSSLFGLLGLAYARASGRLSLSEAERAWLAYRDDRSDFDEWISTVELPAEAQDLPVGTAASLADLVDVAIDTDNAVLESPQTGAYHVVHDGYRYTFEAPPAPAEVDSDPLAAETDAQEGPEDERISEDDSDSVATASSPEGSAGEGHEEPAE